MVPVGQWTSIFRSLKGPCWVEFPRREGKAFNSSWIPLSPKRLSCTPESLEQVLVLTCPYSIVSQCLEQKILGRGIVLVSMA